MGMCVCLCVGAYTRVLVPLEARGMELSRAGISGSYDPPNVVAEELWSSAKAVYTQPLSKTFLKHSPIYMPTTITNYSYINSAPTHPSIYSSTHPSTYPSTHPATHPTPSINPSTHSPVHPANVHYAFIYSILF